MAQTTQLTLSPFDHRQYMRRENFEIFHYKNPGSCVCAPHRHDFYELYCLLEGEIFYVVEGRRYAVRAGDVMLMAPGQVHRADVPGPIRDVDRFVLWISTDYVRALVGSTPRFHYTVLGDLTGRNLIQPEPADSATIRELLFALQREGEGGGPDSAAVSRGIVALLLTYLDRCIASAPESLPHKTEQRYHEIMEVYDYIGAHLKDDLSVSGIAERFFMDKNTLTRQFKRQVGMTPGECVRRRRLEAARSMIRAGVSTQQACVECGFSDYSAFYRAFRRAYGVSPSALTAREEAPCGAM